MPYSIKTTKNNAWVIHTLSLLYFLSKYDFLFRRNNLTFCLIITIKEKWRAFYIVYRNEVERLYNFAMGCLLR